MNKIRRVKPVFTLCSLMIGIRDNFQKIAVQVLYVPYNFTCRVLLLCHAVNLNYLN